MTISEFIIAAGDLVTQKAGAKLGKLKASVRAASDRADYGVPPSLFSLISYAAQYPVAGALEIGRAVSHAGHKLNARGMDIFDVGLVDEKINSGEIKPAKATSYADRFVIIVDEAAQGLTVGRNLTDGNEQKLNRAILIANLNEASALRLLEGLNALRGLGVDNRLPYDPKHIDGSKTGKKLTPHDYQKLWRYAEQLQAEQGTDIDVYSPPNDFTLEGYERCASVNNNGEGHYKKVTDVTFVVVEGGRFALQSKSGPQVAKDGKIVLVKRKSIYPDIPWHPCQFKVFLRDNRNKDGTPFTAGQIKNFPTVTTVELRGAQGKVTPVSVPGISP